MWPVSPRNSSRLRRSRIRMSGLSRRISNATGGVTLRYGGRSPRRNMRQPASSRSPTASRARGRRRTRRDLPLGGDRRLDRIVRGKKRIETGHLEELADALRRVDQDQLALGVAETPEVADQL